MRIQDILDSEELRTVRLEKALPERLEEVERIEDLLRYKDRRDLALDRIHAQFPKSPHTELLFGIFRQAVVDLHSKSTAIALSARVHLAGSIPEAAVCGVDPSWIRATLRRFGLIH